MTINGHYANLKAYKEYLRIRDLIAFNVSGQYAKRKLNQHATDYYFSDGSLLQIRIGSAIAYSDNSKQYPLVIGSIKTNKQGVTIS